MSKGIDFHKHGQLSILEVGLTGVEVGFDGGQIERRNEEASNGWAEKS